MEKETEKIEINKMIDRALKILDLLRTDNRKLGVNEIAKMCEISPSTAFRILKTLEVNGWVYQCNDKSYICGEKICFVTEKNNFYLAMKETASFIMQKYTDKHQQAMNLIVREGADCYVLQQTRTNSLMDYMAPPHAKLPFYACAGGKILLSELPIALINDIIESCWEMIPYTEHTITNPEDFWKELRQVAKQGYAFDNRESSKNGTCIAVPVRDREGNIIASLSFSGFVGVENPEDLLHYLPDLNEASSEITSKLFKYWKN